MINPLRKIIKMLHEKINLNSIDPKFIGTFIIGDRNLLQIGTDVRFGGNVLLYVNAPISIGDHTMIAINTTLHTSTHDYNNHPMWIKRIDKPIKIGKHVWIGTGAIILPGVIIEDFSVVAAGSVVTANVPEGAIVGGNPAKIIKYRDESIYRNSSIQTKDCIIVNGEFNNSFCKEKLD